MRLKLTAPINATPEESYFINKLARTHDTFGIKESWLVIHINREFNIKITDRTIREWKERYNNNKYIGITPQGKIVTVKGLYKMVRHNSKYAKKVVNKAYFDLLCAAIDYRNTLKTVGLVAQGQIQFDEIDRMSDTELIELAKTFDN